jgi:hypothetical protein
LQKGFITASSRRATEPEIEPEMDEATEAQMESATQMRRLKAWKRIQRALEAFRFKTAKKVTPRSIAAECLKGYRISMRREQGVGGVSAAAEEEMQGECTGKIEGTCITGEVCQGRRLSDGDRAGYTYRTYGE